MDVGNLPPLTPQDVVKMFEGDVKYTIRDATDEIRGYSNGGCSIPLGGPNGLVVISRTERNASVYDELLTKLMKDNIVVRRPRDVASLAQDPILLARGAKNEGVR